MPKLQMKKLSLRGFGASSWIIRKILGQLTVLDLKSLECVLITTSLGQRLPGFKCKNQTDYTRLNKHCLSRVCVLYSGFVIPAVHPHEVGGTTPL